jgi:ribose transport system permease protein
VVTPAGHAEEPSPGRELGGRFAGFSWRNYVVYLGFLVVFAFFAVVLGRDFVTVSNLLNIIQTSAPISVMAVGTAFVLSAGEIDLSIGAIVALAALVTARLLELTNPLFAVLGGLAVGLGFGAFNGIITVKVRIPSFLVTLGTLSIVAGLARIITDLQSVPVLEGRYLAVFGSGSIGAISSLVIWTIVVLLVGHLVYRHTAFGQHVLATGGNRKAAESVGINTDRVKVAVLMISGLTAALAGLLYSGWLQGARYSLGEADLLTVIAAVVVGGTSLFGGKGSIVGAVVGSLLMGMLGNGLILMGLDVSQQMVARGVIIILAVALSLSERRA